MLKKYGDEMPIKGYVDADGQKQVCPYCQQPFVSIAFDENDDVGLVCQCTTPDIQELSEMLDG